MTAGGKPFEGKLESFIGNPSFEITELIKGNRFPNVVVGVEGTVMAFWGQNTLPRLKRSEDGGNTWGPLIEVGKNPDHAGRGLGAAVVDETTGDVILFMDGATVDGTHDWYAGHSWRSSDNGKTWVYNGATEDIIKPNEMVEIGGQRSIPDRAITHGNDRGITLRHGEKKGRLVIGARNWSRPGLPFSQKDKYNCAIYSDDGGRTWQTSLPFPVFGTGEGAVEELSDGRIYHSARRNYFHETEFRHERHYAWSYDDGETWQDPAIAKSIPDGPRYRGEERRGANYNGHFGLMGGLVRLPVAGRDILIYSNTDTPCHNRIKGTVWASFDGGETWPVKRLVHDGPFAYSSLVAGRPGTPSEGFIFLQFEGGPNHHYEGVHIARFNLSWLLEGEPTGDGVLPKK